jgi:mitofilin
LATDATIPPSASGTLPPPPPPRKKKGAFSRLFWYSSFLTVGFYTGSTAVSLYSDEYRNLFIEHVPLGERIIDYTDSQGWDRAPVKTKASQPLSGPTATERKIQAKVSETASEVKSKAGKKTGELKEAASQKAQSISKAASENYQKVKGKAKEVVDKAVTSTQDAINKKAETNSAVKTARNRAIKFSDGVEELVNKAEDALKVAVADIVPIPSVPPLSEANAAEPGPAPEVDISTEDEEATPTNVYSGRLPIGFEPPPGYTLPRSKKTSPKRQSKTSASISKPEPAPLLAPQVAPFVSSEPIIGQLASTIDALTRLVESTPSASEKAGTQLERAKQDLTNLAQRIDAIKAEERSVLRAKLDDQIQEYNGKLRQLENQTQQKFDEQEKGWRDSFNQEQQKITEAYQKKLESELETQSEIINQRCVSFSTSISRDSLCPD